MNKPKDTKDEAIEINDIIELLEELKTKTNTKGNLMFGTLDIYYIEDCQKFLKTIHDCKEKIKEGYKFTKEICAGCNEKIRKQTAKKEQERVMEILNKDWGGLSEMTKELIIGEIKIKQRQK
jgi:hypothetical protein